jgi:glycosyltransferase involved in cell wall biosynthesis
MAPYVLFRYGPAVVFGTVDVVEAATGDAWLLSLIPRPLRRAVLVCRSTGLEHVEQDRRRARILGSGEVPSKKDVFYWWGYVLRVIAVSVRRSDIAIFCNSGDAKYAVDRLGCDPARIHVVPFGVSDEVLTGASAIRRAPSHRLAFVGTWIERKGKDDLPLVLRGVMRKIPTVDMLIVGCLEDRADVLNAFPAGLRPLVDVVPHYENAQLPKLLRTATILIFPSRMEGYPIAVAEALACGLVPISYEVDGPADIIRAAKVGHTVRQAGDTDALITAVIDVLGRSKSELALLSATARAWGQRQSWSNIGELQLAIYAQELRSRHRPIGLTLASMVGID